MQIHESLIQTDDAQVTIEASADVLKPILAYARPAVKELKLHVTEGGLEYKVVDKANVAMLTVDVPAESFNTYDVDETTIGIPVKKTMKALRAGRKQHNDNITLSYQNNHLTTTVDRDYDGTEMSLQTTFKTIDPDSIRKEPQAPTVDIDAEASVPRSLFNDVVAAVDEVSDHIKFENDGTDLLVGGESDIDDCVAVIDDVLADGTAVDSIFSLDYCKKAKKALRTLGMDNVDIRLGEDLPMVVEWETEYMAGEWIQAPRIKSD